MACRCAWPYWHGLWEKHENFDFSSADLRGSTPRQIDSSCEKQLLNYLRATEIEVGILFNFGPKAEIRRYVFQNDKKNPREFALIRGKEVRVSD